LPVIANGVVRALSSVSEAFCGMMVALIVSPSTRAIVSSNLRLRNNDIGSVNMGFFRCDYVAGFESNMGMANEHTQWRHLR
jgi:hypothetical protein